MGCKWYLAMTAAEMQSYPGFGAAAWMACHFSAYSTGLSNLPATLPPESLVILDDSTPLAGHDPNRIAAQLAAIENMSGLLLDLQRNSSEAAALIWCLEAALDCPIAVTEGYAKQAGCGVLISPPLNMPLGEAVKPWTDRQLWLDIPFGIQTFTITETGCEVSEIYPSEDDAFPHEDHGLHCRYKIETTPDHARFTLRRSPDALPDILRDANAQQIPIAISLYREFHNNSRFHA